MYRQTAVAFPRLGRTHGATKIAADGFPSINSLWHFLLPPDPVLRVALVAQFFAIFRAANQITQTYDANDGT
jgi:hypothetical protein